MKNKKTIVKLSMLLVLIIALTIGVTYAYFQFSIKGIESSTTIIVDAAQLSIEYVGSNMIEANKVAPSWSEKKYFSININNESAKGVSFSVNVVVDDSNFYTTASSNLGYLNIKLNKCIDENDKVCTEVIQDPTLLDIQSGQKTIANINESAGNKTLYYALEFIYPDTGVPQKQRGEDGLLYHFSGFVTLGFAKNEGIDLNMSTVSIDLDGGSYNGSTTVSVPYGELYYLEYPQKEGYRFKEWEILSGTAEKSGKGLIAKSSTVSVKAKYDTAFSADSWERIAANVQANKGATSSIYKVGDEKEIAIEGFTNEEAGSNGLYTVRIANNSNYNCNLASKTACGFVVEFVDIVEQRQMNSSNTNTGGWTATAMRTYLNGEFLAKLPSDLQSAIAETTVISGHGKDSTSAREDGNWESTDKIYLLGVREVGVDGTNNALSGWDTAYSKTRQLDYYENLGVTADSFNSAIKQYNSSNAWWWLRASTSDSNIHFLAVPANSDLLDTSAGNTSGGVSPAFRIV